jgi:hypothetical protein
VHTRTARLHIRLDPAERDALDFLALKWDATRSDVVRSMVIGAALAECDRLDALDAIGLRTDFIPAAEINPSESSVDALVDVPSIDDVLAGP